MIGPRPRFAPVGFDPRRFAPEGFDPRVQADLTNVRGAPAGDWNIDAKTGGTARARAAIAAVNTRDDKLLAAQKHYPDARYIGDRLVYDNPATGKPTEITRSFPRGDIGFESTSLPGQIPRAVAALAGPLKATGIPGIALSSALGAGAGYVGDALSDVQDIALNDPSRRGEDTRTRGQRAKTAGWDAAFGAINALMPTQRAPGAVAHGTGIVERATEAGILPLMGNTRLPIFGKAKPRIPLRSSELYDSPGFGQLEQAVGSSAGGAGPEAAFAMSQAKAVRGRVDDLADKLLMGPVRQPVELGRAAAKGGVNAAGPEELAGTAFRVDPIHAPSIAKDIEKSMVWDKWRPLNEKVGQLVSDAHPTGVPIPDIRAAQEALQAQMDALVRTGDGAGASRVKALLDDIVKMRAPGPGVAKGNTTFGQLSAFKTRIGELAKLSTQAGLDAKSPEALAAGELLRAADQSVESAVARAGTDARQAYNASTRVIAEFNDPSSLVNREFLRKLSRSSPEAAYKLVLGGSGDVARVAAVRDAMGEPFKEFAKRELLDMGRSGKVFDVEKLVAALDGMTPEMRMVKFGPIGKDVESLFSLLTSGKDAIAGTGQFAERAALKGTAGAVAGGDQGKIASVLSSWLLAPALGPLTRGRIPLPFVNLGKDAQPLHTLAAALAKVNTSIPRTAKVGAFRGLLATQTNPVLGSGQFGPYPNSQ